jgi:hypothetical protein
VAAQPSVVVAAALAVALVALVAVVASAAGVVAVAVAASVAVLQGTNPQKIYLTRTGTASAVPVFCGSPAFLLPVSPLIGCYEMVFLVCL